MRCLALQDARDSAWAELVQTMPDAMVESMTNANNEEKLYVMLSFYGGSYIEEWDAIYGLTAKWFIKYIRPDLMHIVP